MVSTNITLFVFALLGLLTVSVTAQRNQQEHFFSVDTPYAFQSVPFMTGGNGNNNTFPNAPGTVNISIEPSSVPYELCITEGFAFNGPPFSCDPLLYFSYNMTNSLESSLDSSEVDSLFGVRDDLYYETSSLIFPDSSNPYFQTFNVYLRNGSQYFLNFHSLSSESITSGPNATVFLLAHWEANNCDTGYVANPNTNCDDYTLSLPGGVQTYANTNFYSNYNYATFQYTVLPNTAYLNFTYSFANATQSLSQPANIYLRRGSAPWLPNIFDYHLNTTLNFTNGLSQGSFGPVVTPLPGIWYIAIFLPFAQDQIGLTISANVCPSGQAGSNCSSVISQLSNSTAFPVTGTGDYQYFTTTGTTLQVGTGIKNLKTWAPPIYTSVLGWPSNSSFQAAAQNNTMGSVNVVNVANFASPGPAVSPAPAATWYVAVWAPSGYKYYVWANSLCCNNCTDAKTPTNKTQGVCMQNGRCSCPKHYGGLWCYHSGLAVVWIVLIVIACAIVLAIAIGVPVALYLRNRGKARYERV